MKTFRAGLTLRSVTIGLCLLIAAPGAMGGGLAMAPLVGLAGPLAAPWRNLQRLARKASLPLIVFSALMLWVVVTALWAPPHNGSVPLKIVASVATGLLFATAMSFRPERDDSALIRTAAIAFVVLMIALGLIEFVGGLPLNRLASPNEPLELLTRAPWKGTAILVACLWGAAGMLWAQGGRAKAAACALIAAAGVTAFLSDKAANLLAFTIGLAGFAAGFHFRRHAFRVASYFAAVWVLIAPAVMYWAAPFLQRMDLPPSWIARAIIWRQAGIEIPNMLPFGAGLGGFRALARPQHLDTVTFQAMHPHSASVQLWYETGIVGAALAAAALVVFGRAAAKALGEDRIASAAATASLVACMAIASLSYGLWEEWWIATLFAAGGFAAAARVSARPAPAPAPAVPAQAAA